MRSGVLKRPRARYRDRWPEIMPFSPPPAGPATSAPTIEHYVAVAAKYVIASEQRNISGMLVGLPVMGACTRSGPFSETSNVQRVGVGAALLLERAISDFRPKGQTTGLFL